ncbi:hypothetical protein CHGG_00572 [Chaetomium globosum CBS 148.51]|uniref:Uncharacterized protein n=1 Tax=Chaetomium globosum (strain ATCC 6205 / CBS 148.51 / DSM 1962 / NBRC 6347 / NRRL 1970) TaxID=306901 RepID=Q2HGT2_CHAGB|nr:uncharacterized protein CHGG_00572 [Chaetomium globosum CBS 148.51]EAQ92337.1 hypothetical protein CHGG_00572 [Chaetomium globosum CBS 148.51]
MVSFSGVLTAATAGWLLAGAGAVIAHEPEHQHERFVAVETGAVLSPRQYHMSPAHAMLEKREGGCNPGLHPSPPAAGHNRLGDATRPVPNPAYQCDLTRTVTTSGTTSTVTTPGGACCPRVCTGTSQFQCPTSLGGGCCQYNQRCAAGSGSSGSCVFDLTAAPTASIDPGLIPPPGYATSDAMSRSGRGGLAQDYFGPAPAVGPYSETHNTSPMTTPGLDRGGVPLQPHGPGDIAVPVEIDSRLREEERTPVGLAITPGTNRSRDSEDATERYELYGSEMGQMSPTWPPYSDGMPSPGERPK